MAKHIFENEIQLNKANDIGNKFNDFETLEKLGEGSFGKVNKVKSKKDQNIYAMKIITLDKAKEIDVLRNEIEIMKSLDNPHIVKYYNYFEEQNNIYILMEYIDNGDLQKYSEQYRIMKKTIDEKEILEFLYQSLSGLYYIHKKQLIHRDIKPGNIFLTSDKKIKIGDFGLSIKRRLNKSNFTLEKETEQAGSKMYKSPEIIEGKPYGSKVDIYSLGATFYQLRFLHYPREGIKNQNKEIIGLGDRALVCDNNNSILVNIIYKMMEKDPDKRPNTGDIFEEIKKVYNSQKIHCSSIYSVYRALLSFNIFHNKIPEHIPLEKEKQLEMPITCTLKLALDNILELKKENDIIFHIRDILIWYNSKFIDPGEINCLDLIDYIIKNLFLENNHNTSYKSAYLFTQENDQVCLDFNKALEKYKSNIAEYFKSFVSNYFFGSFEIQRQCTQCNRLRTFFENFYYLTLNIDTAINNGIYENDPNFIYNCLQRCTQITVNKFCPGCNTITKQNEAKIIYEKPCNIIIYLKKDDQNNISNIKYPLEFDLVKSNEVAFLKTLKYHLKAVIQQYEQKGEKLYGCTFQYDQKWFFANGYNILNSGRTPDELSTGNVVMLFYSSEN